MATFDNLFIISLSQSEKKHRTFLSRHLIICSAFSLHFETQQERFTLKFDSFRLSACFFFRIFVGPINYTLECIYIFLIEFSVPEKTIARSF